MKNKTTPSRRSRAEILAEIANLPPSVQGTLSSYKNVRKNGTTVIYHNLQWWADGRNHSLFIPESKVSEMKDAIQRGKTLKKLVNELSMADAAQILSTDSPLKKNSHKSS